MLLVEYCPSACSICVGNYFQKYHALTDKNLDKKGGKIEVGGRIDGYPTSKTHDDRE